MTAAAISKTNLLGMFTIFKELIQFSGLSTLNSRFSSSASSNHYYEYDPLVSGLRTEGYPYVVIESSADDSVITIKNHRRYEYVVAITIRIQYSARGSSTEPHSQATLNNYAHEIIEYVNSNRDSIKTNYNIEVNSATARTSGVEIINDEKICERIVEFNCSSELNVE